MDHRLRNLIANYAGLGTRIGLSFLFTVVYFQLLGAEGYGLIGVYASLTVLASLLDLGLFQATVREVALRGTDPGRRGELRPVFLTYGLIVTAIGWTLGASVAALSGWLAADWLDVSQLSQHDAATALVLMGGSAGLLLPIAACHAMLLGLERQVLSNGLAAIALALRGGASIAALTLLAATPVTFFLVQLSASAIEVLVTASLVWRLLPPAAGRLVDIAFLRESWRFATGVWLAVLVARATTMVDKLLLSALLPLESFGRYSLAVAVVMAFDRLAGPFTTAYFPRFVELVEQRRRDDLSRLYRRVTGLASAVFLALGLFLAVHARVVGELLNAVDDVASRFPQVLMLLALATTLNMLAALPFSLQFAHGMSRPALWLNLARAAIYLPALVLIVPLYGALGAAGLWLATSVVFVAMTLLVTQRRTQPGPMAEWLGQVVALPAAAAVCMLGLGTIVTPTLPPVLRLPWLAFHLLLTLAATFLVVLPPSRFWRRRRPPRDPE